jgi:hypothetical protein
VMAERPIVADPSSAPTPVEIFVARALRSLATDPALRTAWAEEVVGHFLQPGVEFPDAGSYFGLEWHGITISVRHSTGSHANFDIERRSLVYDTRLARARRPPPYTVANPEGWLGHPALPPQHWSDVHVYAWLPEMDSNDTVLDFDAWRFVALSRAEMYRHFPATRTNVSISVLKEFGFVGGDELADRIATCHAAVDADTPALDRRTREEIRQALAGGDYSSTLIRAT